MSAKGRRAAISAAHACDPQQGRISRAAAIGSSELQHSRTGFMRALEYAEFAALGQRHKLISGKHRLAAQIRRPHHPAQSLSQIG